MQYEIEVGGRRQQVVVKRVGGRFAIAVDGDLHDVDVTRIDGQIVSVILDGVRPFDVSVTPEAGGAVVHVDGTPVAVAVNGRRRWGQKSDRDRAAGPQRLTAPMPGKVVRVLVRTGDNVQPRQPVVVVEAMKMENELRAGREGTVAEVQAREGMSVDAGALLVVIQ
jgi:biotin carboxyl carrier protein